MFPQALNRYYLLPGWLQFIQHESMLAPALLIILDEAGIPLPFPSDFVIAYMGYQVSKGVISYLTAFLFPLLMAIVGSTILYVLARRYGEKLVLRFGRHINLDKKRLKQLERQFDRYGVWVILIGRHIPGIRIPITVFAGMSGISYPKFILSTIVSVTAGVIFYLSVGEKLGPRTVRMLHGHPRFYFTAFVPLLIFALFFLLLRHHANKKRARS